VSGRRDAAGALRAQPGTGLLALYDTALPQVHGYLLARCGDRSLAEDLTSEVFLAAVAARDDVGLPWLIGTARHKLVDHWRRSAREQRVADDVADASSTGLSDPWDAHLDALRARDVLAGLGPHHRAALVLRHVDGLPVPEVAAHLGRTLHATEALLTRARRAFRRAYEEGGHG
jgi:RNA polymerase sigma-70 factor, ECF subfamily